MVNYHMSHKIVEHFQDPTICDQLKDKILATPSGVPTAGIEPVAFESAKRGSLVFRFID